MARQLPDELDVADCCARPGRGPEGVAVARRRRRRSAGRGTSPAPDGHRRGAGGTAATRPASSRSAAAMVAAVADDLSILRRQAAGKQTAAVRPLPGDQRVQAARATPCRWPSAIAERPPANARRPPPLTCGVAGSGTSWRHRRTGLMRVPAPWTGSSAAVVARSPGPEGRAGVRRSAP